jgi:hypothetical protein
MDKISIPGKEAKKHIQEALKAVFPGFKFSLTSEYDSVRVSWTDGPLTPDVQKVLNRFESYTRVLWKTDYTEATGYEWKGQLYVGPRYLSATRQLSDERKAALIEYMAEGDMDYFGAKVFERVDAEREMILEGKLEGFEPRQRPDLMRDTAPEIDKRVKKDANTGAVPAPEAKELVQVLPFPANFDSEAPVAPMETNETALVIPFPKNRAKAVREHQFISTLEPEQRLKFRALQMLFQVDADKLMENSLSVDDAFLAAAYMFK